MAYLNLDDNYPDHPKVAALSDAAYRLHGSAMFYAARFGLDGYLTQQQLADCRRYTKRGTDELIAGGLLHGRGDGCDTKTCPPGDPGRYLLHDFLQWNKPRSWWDAKRKADAERLAKWRAEHGKDKEGKP